MRNIYSNPFVRLGNKIFRFRRLFYGIPLLVLLADSPHLYYPFNSHFYDEVVEISAILIALAGVVFRFWVSGSSRRTVLKKRNRARFYFRNTGAFSILRQPYFAGDFLIVLGLSIPLLRPVLILFSLAIFLLCYLPILFAGETILVNRHRDYPRYCENVRLFVPSFKHWKPSKARFRWSFALRKEGNISGMVGILFVVIEQFRELIIQGRWDGNPFWLSMLIPFFILFVLWILLDRSLEDLPDIPNLPDPD